MPARISAEELERLATDLESDRVERKESLGDREKIGQAICAFANDLPGHRKPGVLFIGLRDDGTPAGKPVTDQMLRNLAAFRDDGRIQPIPSLDVFKETIRGSEVAVMIVQPCLAPPVAYKGVVWVRVGPRLARATREEIRRLAERRRAVDLPYEPATAAFRDARRPSTGLFSE
jgi:ATP-dependent DNA helicase RecG